MYKKLILRLIKKTLLLGLVLLFFTGCGDSARRSDRREENDPALRRARVKKKAQDVDGAIELYNRALERKPRLARAHLEVALLYDSYKEDYNRAIYHYQRYLELRPTSEKKQLIQDLIRRARLSYAASLPDTPSGAIKEIAELKQLNSSLKTELEELTRRYRELENSSYAQDRDAYDADVRNKPLKPAAAPAQPAVRTYRVERGDTLSRIAKKMYDDSSKWQRIYDANRNTMRTPGNLDVGQMLVIP